ncbi:flavin-containing monooxygenase [Microbulbifer variabilis]|uniref:flavin-containing monooxygenase n=1 Tax=Microbulbifer variabilis TaxID=266805 RepID=UPI001CFF48D2|nr:NAD(P)/FAD-dependent oxidoreductase [Microbulbifer variabilis]
MMTLQPLHFDVLVIGAGLSGIGAACHLRRECPSKKIAILERRSQIGGTWDLFRYPGIRSDSDMFSFGFDFRPWPGLKVLADGPAIRQYLNDTAEEYEITKDIHFNVDLYRANWDSPKGLWILEGSDTLSGEPRRYSCKFLISCTGYYDHHRGYLPKIPGAEQFQGNYIHPQHWPEDLDYHDKKIVVIGSGATAVTLVPALADRAGHVTMLQRSPSYVISVPAFDKLSARLLKFLPKSWVFKFARWRNVKIQRWLFKASKRWPRFMRNLFLKGVRKSLPKNYDMRHFTPDYNPWDQRVCAVPDDDFFKAIHAGKASVETGEIKTIGKTYIELQSGQKIDADIIITATGLNLQVLGGMQLCVDGERVPINEKLTYKAVLLEGVPNMSWIFGYTNAPWTLKADISARYICRLLNYMDKHEYDICLAEDIEGCSESSSVMSSLNSGYVKRGNHVLPRQGNKYPWRLLNNYEQDSKILLQAPIEDGILTFQTKQLSKDLITQVSTANKTEDMATH